MHTTLSNFECNFCHERDGEVVRNRMHGFIVLCNDCGYAQSPTLTQLLAS